ncbi:UNVERIFIED_CONTAM: hypothetical protein RMT77_002401 [Armadillidium vulgare]
MDAEILKLGKELGLKGKELIDFFKESQTRAAAEAEKVREHEIKMLELQNNNNGNLSSETNSFITRAPKLPPFSDNTDEIDCYLERFERIAEINGWVKNDWASHLSTLLTGSALIVYSRMSREDSKDYDKLKYSLLTRYNLTEEGYRSRFRNSKPLYDERPIQFTERLRNYLNKWTELSLTPKTFEGLSDLILSEQFMNTYPRDVTVFLRERNIVGINRISEETENYIMARDRNCLSTTTKNPTKEIEHSAKNTNTDFTKEKWTVSCYKCGRKGHRVSECRAQTRNKFNFQIKPTNRQWQTYENQTQRNNWREEPKRAAVSSCVDDRLMEDNERSTAAPYSSKEGIEFANDQEISSCVEGNSIMLACGKAVPFVKTACVRTQQDDTDKKNNVMPVLKGLINGHPGSVLRDTGCNSVVVKREFVEKNQLTGKRMKMLLIDNSIRDVPVAKINVVTPYYEGEVEALALQDAIYDLIIGNISGARAPNDPLPYPSPSCAAIKNNQYTSSNQKSSPGNPCGKITKKDLVRLQGEDESLNKCRSLICREKGKSMIPHYIMKGGILQRVSQNNGDYIEQIVVPKKLRQHLISMAHDSIMGGHLGIKKTMDKLITGFYWPGINEDVSRFCHSCDICQKTVSKGSITKTPVGRMPLIDIPFKRVAVDLIGPIKPASEEGHKYILTLVDYATRYPEAVSLKSISTETVAEALVDMYSRLGVPEEVLTDLGTQFTSECMKQVSKLLNIKQLSTSPYHPMCNGLVEKFNGTLKKMLRRLCYEQPKRWNRFINPLLFAYREVPQESTGFSPFELLYGRTVRGPIQIIKELWTNEEQQIEIKNSYQYVFELQEKLEETLKIAINELAKSQNRYKHYYDRNAKDRKFMIGDSVLILLPTDSNKLLMQWKGPYEVIGKIGENNYHIKIGEKRKTYHANLLKRYFKRREREDEVTEIACIGVIDFDEMEDGDIDVREEIVTLGRPLREESVEQVIIGEHIDKKKKMM